MIESIILFHLQRGAIHAVRCSRATLDHGNGFIRENYERALACRDIICDALIAANRVRTLKPDGALYAFFKINAVTDSRATALDIVDKISVEFVSGSTAFSLGGELCFRAGYLTAARIFS